jgi:hypothetical protein
MRTATAVQSPIGFAVVRQSARRSAGPAGGTAQRILLPRQAGELQAFPATRTRSMAETSLKPLKAILETIRERADYALKQLQEAEEERSMR